MSDRVEDFDFVTDAELIRRLRLPEKVGRAALRELDKSSPARRPFPKPDPLFGHRRFWPAVKQWLLDYKGFKTSTPVASVQHSPPWRENWSAQPSRKSQQELRRPGSRGDREQHTG